MILDKFSLKGKSGIVTGGGTGLGKAMATAVVQAGAEIFIVGRRREVLDEAAKEMTRFGGPIIPFQADMTQMGVFYEKHHSFNINELIETIKTTSLNDKIDQFKRIFTG